MLCSLLGHSEAEESSAVSACNTPLASETSTYRSGFKPSRSLLAGLSGWRNLAKVFIQNFWRELGMWFSWQSACLVCPKPWAPPPNPE